MTDDQRQREREERSEAVQADELIRHIEDADARADGYADR